MPTLLYLAWLVETVNHSLLTGSASSQECNQSDCGVVSISWMLWNDRNISFISKIQMMCSLVSSIFLYACESWTLTAKVQRRIQAMEMKFYCKILHISYKDHVTNKEVHAKIQQAIGPHKDLLTILKGANCSGIVMSPIHQAWPKPSFKAQ